MIDFPHFNPNEEYFKNNPTFFMVYDIHLLSNRYLDQNLPIAFAACYKFGLFVCLFTPVT